MQLICLSVSYHNTPVEWRECLSLPQERMEEAFSKSPLRTGVYEPIAEMVILSTCNRLEVYALVSFAAGMEDSLNAAVQPVLSYMSDVLEIPTAQITPFIRRYAGIQTVEHLFQVASGLDSIAIGETHILGQVSRALETGLQLGSTRHALSSLFRAAIYTGKRVRTETEIGRHPTNISTLGVQLAEKTCGSLSAQNILVVGAGKMGGCTLEALRALEAQQVFLTSRTHAHALEMAGRLGGSVLPYESLPDSLVQADVVFTSSAAPQPILHYTLLEQVMRQRPERPLTLVDLAVPRNVETRVKEIPGVQVLDMDDLQSFAKTTVFGSYQEITRAGGIVKEEVAAYEKLLRVIPFIGELHKKVEEIRQRELEKTLRHLRDYPPEVSDQLEVFSRALVRKILHEPTMHLRAETDQEALDDYLSTLKKLFALSENTVELSLYEGESWEH